MSENEKQKNYEKHLYGVIYLDVLGQKELMKRLESGNVSPEDETQMQKVLGHVSHFLKRLTDLKKEFIPDKAQLIYDSFSAGAKNMQSEILMGGVTIERVKKSLEDLSFGIQQFSDSTLLYVRIDGEDPYVNRNLFGLLISMLPSVMLDAFLGGIFLRGSITIGHAWEIGENNLYGLVIHDAYVHEEKIARWPRIVVSKAAMDFLKNDFASLKQVLPQDNPTRMSMAALFINGVDGVPQLNPIPFTVYLQANKEQCDEVRKIFQKIVKQVDDQFLILQKSYESKEIDVGEYSKRLMRYRILKRDLLCGAMHFERSMHYRYKEKPDETPFDLPEWLRVECPKDLSFMTYPERIFEEIDITEQA